MAILCRRSDHARYIRANELISCLSRCDRATLARHGQANGAGNDAWFVSRSFAKTQWPRRCREPFPDKRVWFWMDVTSLKVTPGMMNRWLERLACGCVDHDMSTVEEACAELGGPAFWKRFSSRVRS